VIGSLAHKRTYCPKRAHLPRFKMVRAERAHVCKTFQNSRTRELLGKELYV